MVTVNEKTGEVKGLEAVYVSKAQNEPAYVKLYLDGIEELYKMRSCCWPVLIWIVKRMGYANGEQVFEFGAPMRRRAGEVLQLSVWRINHALSDLVESGALLRVERGLYQLNPMIFGRGEWKEIAKLRAKAEKNASTEKNPAKTS